jgi:hypothetical protein
MNVDLSPIKPGSRYRHRAENIEDDPLYIITNDLIIVPKAHRIVDTILQNPISFHDGNKNRETILQSFEKYFGPFNERSDNNKFQLLINQVLRFYNKYVFENLLYQDLIGAEADDPDVLMSTAPSFALQQRLKKFFVSHCTIYFYSVHKMLERYREISQDWPKVMGGYFENFAHFCIYIIEHEIAHSLWFRVHKQLIKNDVHNKLFWNILHAFSGQNVPHSLAHMYYYLKPDIDLIKKAGENPVYSKSFFQKILRGIQEHGMTSVRDREALAQEIFNSVIALREIHA